MAKVTVIEVLYQHFLLDERPTLSMCRSTRAAIAATIASMSSSASGIVEAEGPGAPFTTPRASSLDKDPARGRLVVAGVGDVGRGTV